MTSSFKSLRYTTAIAVSLVALSTANQANAQCTPAATAGNDTITCSGTQVGDIDLLAGNDTLTNSGAITGDISVGAGDDTITNSGTINVATINLGTGVNTITNTETGMINIDGSVGVVQDRIFDAAGSDLILNNDGVIELAGTTTNFDVIHTRGSLTVNNTGRIENAIATAATPTGTDVLVNVTAGATDITNSGQIFAQEGQRFLFHNTGGAVTIDNQVDGTISGRTQVTSGATDFTNAGAYIGNIDFSNSADTLTNSGTLDANYINFGSGTNVLTNNAGATINIDGTIADSFDGVQRTITDEAGSDLTINNDGVIELTNGGFNVDLVHNLGALTVNNTGRIESTASLGGNVVFVNVGSTTDITNSGQIIAGAGQRAVNQANTSAATVTNLAGGSIEGDINFNSAADIITTAGNITGDITQNGGNDTFIYDTATATQAGDNDGGAGTDLFRLDTTNGSGVYDAGAVTLYETLEVIGGNTATFDNNLATSFTDFSFTGADTGLTIGSGTTLMTTNVTAATTNTIRIEAGAAIDTPAALGNRIEIEVAGPASAGQINNTAGVVNITGATIVADVTGIFSNKDEVLIGTGTGAAIGLAGGTGQVVTDITDNSILFDFGIADGGQAEITTGGANANELYLLVNRRSIEETVGGTNNKNSGGGLDGLLAVNGGAGLPPALLAAINNASTVEELEAIVDATLPQVDGASLSAAQNVTNNTIRLVSDRLTTIRGTGVGTSGISSGDLTENLQMWGQVFGQNIEQGLRKGIAGYDADTYGITVGADTEGLHDKATVGLAFSYANTDVDSDNVTNTQSDINSYNVTLYGDYDLDDNTYLVGDIGYTYGDNETTRFNVGGIAGLNADSDYGSHQFQARAIVGRDYTPSQYEGLRVTPKAQVRYTHYQNEDISETGAGGANLNVESEGLNSLELGVGVDVRKDYVQDNGGILSPEVSVGYRYDVIGDAVQTTSTFDAGGASFTTEGADPDQDTFNFGLGVGYTTPSSMEFTVSYDYENKDEFDGHSAFIRFAAPF